MLTIAELDPNEWTRIKIKPPPRDPSREINLLVELQQTTRAALMNEIIEQNMTFMADFLRLLMITPTSHPHTYLLLKTGARVAELTMPFFKHQFDRPRPSQVCPWIMPPLEVAGHPSYPQGHGLMAHLKAACVADALGGTHPRMVDALRALAERIAWNRVVAGFHYPTDSDGARELAQKLMKSVRKSGNFQCVVKQAKKEWLAQN
jgi:acid phosphatase (class A)